MLCDRGAVPLNADAPAIERGASQRLRVLPRYARIDSGRLKNLYVREVGVDYQGAGRLLRFYEEGLHGYTYLEG